MEDETTEPSIPPLRPLTPEQIDALLGHLPHLEAVARGDFEPGSAARWGADSVLSEHTRAFFHDLYDLGVIQSFAWTEWERGQELAESEGQLARASLEDIHKLIIQHVRFDHFSEGYFDDMVENGLFARVLRRLAALRADL